MNSKPSKSARKRENLALQKLGERLLDLSEEQLVGIVADERLRDAVRAATRIRSHGALRRQKQYIGRLMRDLDSEPIRAGLDAVSSSARREKALFREAEAWRDRIAGGGPADLEAFLELAGPGQEKLEAAVDSLRSAAHDKARKQAKRTIFKEIHRVLADRMQSRGSSI